MKRKPKMHNEQEFNLDNVYQEDERQLDNLDDSSFDLRYKWQLLRLVTSMEFPWTALGIRSNVISFWHYHILQNFQLNLKVASFMCVYLGILTRNHQV